MGRMESGTAKATADRAAAPNRRSGGIPWAKIAAALVAVAVLVVLGRQAGQYVPRFAQ